MAELADLAMEALRRVQDAHADLLATASMTVVPGSVQDE
jgi:hypothetical protein